MHREPFRPAKRWLASHQPRERGFAQTLTVGVLTATLAASSVGPVIAKGPHLDRSAAQLQEHVVSANDRPEGGRQHAGVSSEARGKGKHNRGKTITRTFANGGAIAIPGNGSASSGPAGPYPSAIQVSGFKKARIRDVNLTLRGFTHEFPRDVDFFLVAPNGRNAVVMSDAGLNGAGPSDVAVLTLRLDDEAADPLPLNALLTSGSFQPNDDTDSRFFPDPAPEPSANTALSTFDGITPNGRWQLFVVDNGAGDTGSVTDGWSLQITAKSKKKR